MAALGLRGKSLILLLLTCLLMLSAAGLIGYQLLDGMQGRFGEAYARNLVQLNRERMFVPVSRELALAQRLAGSQITVAWLRDEQEPQWRELFFREAAGYQAAFSDRFYFAASAQSNGYYANGAGQAPSQQPRYVLEDDNSRDEWFFQAIGSESTYQINVDRSAVTGELKVWFNVQVREGERVLGLVGSGVNMQMFIDELVASDRAGVESMILDAYGSILVHPNPNLVTLNADTPRGRSLATSLLGQLDDMDDAKALRALMDSSRSAPGEVLTLEVSMDGGSRLLAISWLPELQWFIASSVDLSKAQVVELRPLLPLIGLFLLLMLALVGGTAWLVERRVLRPLRNLRVSAQALAAGQVGAPLPVGRDDEIGELSAAFEAMVRQVRRHTAELEDRVRERTRELELANREMLVAHKKIDDSIEYASLIQRAILPGRQQAEALCDNLAVLWLPRDVVGGDFYLYRSVEQGGLIGIVDCAGHGVPGAMMTMAAHAAIDQALDDGGPDDPAAILMRTDVILRGMLLDDELMHGVATNLDMALAYIDLQQRQVVYCGAKIALYYHEAGEVHKVPAARRAIADKRPGQYVNERVELVPGRTFYMTTDGFLDQAGGERGFGFGHSRFEALIRDNAHLPLCTQRDVFRTALSKYQGDYPQRDDITMLCFRFD